MKIVPYMSKGALFDAVFVNAPSGEPVELSLNRLARAIAADGLSRFYSPLAVWYAYRHHPTLSQDYKQVMEYHRNARNEKPHA